jgi:hypothetical protein
MIIPQLKYLFVFSNPDKIRADSAEELKPRFAIS